MVLKQQQQQSWQATMITLRQFTATSAECAFCRTIKAIINFQKISFSTNRMVLRQVKIRFLDRCYESAITAEVAIPVKYRSNALGFMALLKTNKLVYQMNSYAICDLPFRSQTFCATSLNARIMLLLPPALAPYIAATGNR